MGNRKPDPQEQRGKSKGNCWSAKVIEVIEVVTKAGRGTEQDPTRIITEYWSKEGKLLAVSDPQYDV